MKNFKAGNYVSQGSFKSFIPEEINREWSLDNLEVIDLLIGNRNHEPDRNSSPKRLNN